MGEKEDFLKKMEENSLKLLSEGHTTEAYLSVVCAILTTISKQLDWILEELDTEEE